MVLHRESRVIHSIIGNNEYSFHSIPTESKRRIQNSTRTRREKKPNKRLVSTDVWMQRKSTNKILGTDWTYYIYVGILWMLCIVCLASMSNVLHFLSNKLIIRILLKNFTYRIRPSSPADQKTDGLSGTVAKRFTRCVWHVHFQIGDDKSVARFMSNTKQLRSAAAVAINASFDCGKNFTENIFPWCGVNRSSTGLWWNGFHIMIRLSSDPEARSRPLDDHSRQLTHPLWPSNLDSTSKFCINCGAAFKRFRANVSMS